MISLEPIWNNTTDRCLKVKEIYYINRSLHGHHAKGHLGEAPRGWAQPGRCGAKNEGWWANVFFWRGVSTIWVEHTSKRLDGNLTDTLEYLQVTIIGRQEGELVTGTSLFTLVSLVTWESCSEPICGNVEASGKQEGFKINNTCYLQKEGCQEIACLKLVLQKFNFY